MRWSLRGAAISDTNERPRWLLYAILAAALAVYFVDLGGSSIWDANEAFYVETPREMIAAHDFINPSFNYLPRFNKPVLSYWIVAGFYKLFGVSVAVQRIPIAIGAMLIIACAFILAHDSRAGIRDSGLWAALGLAVNPRLVMFARRIFIDVWLCAFLALTLTCFALSERYPEQRRRYLVWMYVTVALGTLTKGPVAIVIPALAFAVYLALLGELRRVRDMMLPLGILVVAAIVLPWYATLYYEHGWAQIKSFFLTENIERFTEGTGVRQTRGLLFYLPVLLSDSFPGSALLVAGAVLWWRRRERLELLLWSWIVVIVGFFSFSAAKQDLYIFPVVPAVAAIAGLVIGRACDDASARRWFRWTLVVVGVVFAAMGAGVWYVFVAGGADYALNGAAALGGFAIAGGLLCAIFACTRAPFRAAGVLLAAVVAVNWTFVLRVLPDFERYKPVPALSRDIAERLRPGDVIAHYQVALPSMVYYLGRHVEVYFDESAFVAAVRSPSRVYAVLSDADYQALAPEIGTRTCVLSRHPTFNVKLGSVLARAPLPELLLISNDCR